MGRSRILNISRGWLWVKMWVKTRVEMKSDENRTKENTTKSEEETIGRVMPIRGVYLANIPIGGSSAHFRLLMRSLRGRSERNNKNLRTERGGAWVKKWDALTTFSRGEKARIEKEGSTNRRKPGIEKVGVETRATRMGRSENRMDTVDLRLSIGLGVWLY